MNARLPNSTAGSVGGHSNESRVVVTGAGGMLGTAVSALLGDLAVALTIDQLDITDAAAVWATLERTRPAFLINCAAATDVDRCETDRGFADRVNVEGPRLLAEGCSRLGVKLVHVSTDYVFDGEKGAPYREDDPVAPASHYGLSKLRGEQAVLAAAPAETGTLLVRTSWVFGSSREQSGNFPLKVLEWAAKNSRLRIVSDQWGSPTYAPFLAAGMLRLLAANATGVYHLAGTGCASRLELAREVVACASREVELDAALAAEFPAPAPRPRATCLDCAKAGLFGATLPPWQEGVRRYVAEVLGAATNVTGRVVSE